MMRQGLKKWEAGGQYFNQRDAPKINKIAMSLFESLTFPKTEKKEKLF